MKKRIFIAFLVILLSGLLLMVIYNNYNYSNNIFGMIFSNTNLTSEEKEWLSEKEFLIYSSDHASPPLRYVDEKTKQYVGMVVDYVDAISLELGIEIKLKPEIWQDALFSLENGEIDMVDMYPSELRSEKYFFTNTTFYQNAILVVKNTDPSINSIDDLANKKVGAQRGDFVNEFLQREASQAIIINTDDYGQAVKLLKDGHVDAVVGDESVVYHFLKYYEMTEDFHILDELLYENSFVFGIPKTEAILVDILNKAIHKINQRDTLIRIQQKWFGLSTPINNPINGDKYILFGGIFIIFLISGSYIFYSWNSELKKEVNARTIALQHSERTLKTTFDSLSHLMIIIDSEGRILNANSAYLQTVELNLEKVIGSRFTDLLNIEIDFIKNKLIEVEYQGLFYEISTHELNVEKNLMIVMMKNITTKKINEKQLLFANKMAAVGQLAAGVAHEIRNPLGIIRNYTYLLKKDKTLDQDLKEKSFEMIELSVSRASKIIDNLLNFSSISGNVVLVFNLSRFIEDIIELHEKILSKSHISVAVVCDPNLEVELNNEAMKHILINLISNAIDAIKSTGKIEIICHNYNDKLELRIKDSGIGMDENQLSQVFNPFYTTKSPGKGTGLGLYIVYSEIQKLGGDIRVESQQNIGSEFIISLPYKE